MPSRRTILRRGALAVAAGGLVAGCSARNEDAATTTARRTTRSTTRETTTDPTTTATRTTTETTDETTTQTTTGTAEKSWPYAEFVHRSPVLDDGVVNADTPYYARRFASAEAAAEFDLSAAREEFPAQNLDGVAHRIRNFDFDAASLLVVQAEVSSARHGLEVEIEHDRGSERRFVVLPQRRRDDDWDDSPAVSTRLVPVPSAVEPTVTLPTLGFGPVPTFRPPNEPLYEAQFVRPDDQAPDADPWGALITESAAAERYPNGEPIPFLRETDFTESSVVALQATVQGGGYYLVPRRVERDGKAVTAEIWECSFHGGINAVYDATLFVRVPGSTPPERATIVDEWRRTDSLEVVERATVDAAANEL